MTSYSVADAKAGLPRLIDRAIAGEEVIITRHGRPVAELRPARIDTPVATAASYERLRSGRIKPRREAPTSVALLNMIYDNPPSGAFTWTRA